MSTTPQKFWNRIAAPDQRGCMNWTGYQHKDGYGALSYQRRYWLTHRLAWLLTHGDIPEGFCVCHSCDNRLCCNPDHLFLGSHADNMGDMKRKGRRLRVNTGERNGRAKVTAEQVSEIRASYSAGGARQVDLAAKFGLSQGMISAIVRGAFWK